MNKILNEDAQEAERILKSKTMQRAIKEMHQTCYNRIKSTSYDEKEERENIYNIMQCLEIFEESFKTIIRDGTTLKESAPLSRKMIRN